MGYIIPEGTRMRGQLVLSGRTKDTIVLSSGENVSPAPIEDALCASALIDQCVLFGQDKRLLGALVCANQAALQEHMRVRFCSSMLQCLRLLSMLQSHHRHHCSL